jgi:hypothetical protein
MQHASWLLKAVISIRQTSEKQPLAFSPEKKRIYKKKLPCNILLLKYDSAEKIY